AAGGAARGRRGGGRLGAILGRFHEDRPAAAIRAGRAGRGRRASRVVFGGLGGRTGRRDCGTGRRAAWLGWCGRAAGGRRGRGRCRRGRSSVVVALLLVLHEHRPPTRARLHFVCGRSGAGRGTRRFGGRRRGGADGRRRRRLVVLLVFVGVHEHRPPTRARLDLGGRRNRLRRLGRHPRGRASLGGSVVRLLGLVGGHEHRPPARA